MTEKLEATISTVIGHYRQHNNSADKNAYQKPPFNKKNSNSKSGSNLVNNIDDKEPIVNLSDEEEQSASNK
jgi:hypothetical protein